MQDILVVVDMQNDFIDGALGTPEAAAIVPAVKQRIQEFDGRVLFTRDTHGEDYLETQEGKNLPVKHCIRGSGGWEICPELRGLCRENPIDKGTFGSTELGALLQAADRENRVRTVTLVGLCTDICVIANAMIAKTFLPEAEIVVDASCCAGVTPESHRTALAAMKACQIRIEGETVHFYEEVEDHLLKFAVIIARSGGKYVFCKHRDRETLEIPGGHREPGEDIGETARRELREETGAIDFDITPVCVYSVTHKDNFHGEESFGMLYFAEIRTFEEELDSEIEKIFRMEGLPERWTYPLIQPHLMAEAARRGFLV